MLDTTGLLPLRRKGFFLSPPLPMSPSLSSRPIALPTPASSISIPVALLIVLAVSVVSSTPSLALPSCSPIPLMLSRLSKTYRTTCRNTRLPCVNSWQLALLLPSRAILPSLHSLSPWQSSTSCRLSPETHSSSLQTSRTLSHPFSPETSLNSDGPGARHANFQNRKL